MLEAERTIAFLATADAASARQFYEGLLGLPLLEDSPFALVFDMGPTQLRIQKLGAFTAAPHTVLGWSVRDIASAVRSLGAAGVSFERFDGMPQDELGIWASPSGAKIAWFKDPAGNLLSLTQF
jgi:catechol 2,3-dioxygenase-like lactoylglutathione lyase family enzyme